MTTPDVPLRMELTFELPGTPEQVWDAIATANGISAWFIPTDMDEHVGGAVEFHMGEDSSKGTITDYDAAAPHRVRGARLGVRSPATPTRPSRRSSPSSSSRRSPAARACCAS